MEIKKGGEISESHSAWAVAYVLQKAPAYLAKKENYAMITCQASSRISNLSIIIVGGI